MTYKETLEYLFTTLPLFSRIGSPAYKKDITNTVKLCVAIGNPQQNFKSIHIAGTNGKGSTSHMLAAVLQQAGYKTGLYTSPHLKDFRERIRINGKMISEEFVVDFVRRIKTISEEIEPSFFELTVAMAFDYFAAENVDIAVIETGLGGRLDSTNILLPQLSIITNIGYDHQNILGNSLEEIASEKAGIIKPATPVVIGESNNTTRPIFIEKALQNNAPVIFAEEEYEMTTILQESTFLHVEYLKAETRETVQIKSDLNGIYQQKNIATVLTAIDALNKQDFTIGHQKMIESFSNVKTLTGLRGRWDVIAENPLIVLDVAHNEDGVKQLLKQLDLLTYDRLHLVIGMVSDKDVTKVLSILPKNGLYYFTNAAIPRAMPAKDLQKKAEAFQLYGHAFESVEDAFEQAKNNAEEKDLVLVCGSVFVVGEIDFAIEK